MCWCRGTPLATARRCRRTRTGPAGPWRASSETSSPVLWHVGGHGLVAGNTSRQPLVEHFLVIPCRRGFLKWCFGPTLLPRRNEALLLYMPATSLLRECHLYALRPAAGLPARPRGGRPHRRV